MSKSEALSEQANIIDTRYPGLGLSFGEDVAREAIELASEVLEFVEGKMRI